MGDTLHIRCNRKIIIVILLVIVLILIAWILNAPANKAKLVLNLWHDDFEANSISALQNSNADDKLHGVRLDGIFKSQASESDEAGIVQYMVKAYGLPSAGTYYGFYYSPDDEPAAYQNIDCRLMEDGDDRWSWSKDGASGVTYKICDKFYYYKVVL
mgnify:FL=1